MLAGSEVDRHSADPSYGIYAYTGREWDPEINLYYYRARYYDPETGTFIEEDPAHYGDGMSLYAYVGGNPVMFVDPSGRTAQGPQGPSCPGCPPSVKQSSENLCMNAGKIWDWAVRRCVRDKCREGFRIDCQRPFCGVTPKVYGRALEIDRIAVCPNNVSKAAGQGGPCMERVIAHELMHICGGPPTWAGKGHDVMTARTKSAIPCPF